jgi:hypothetical protein
MHTYINDPIENLQLEYPNTENQYEY